jgi:hypothetical protein
MRLTALSVATALLAGCSTTSIKNVPAAAAFSAAKAPYGFMSSDPMFQFVGTWEGTLEGHSGPNLVAGAGSKIAFRIVIDPQQAHVFQQLDSRWSEMKPGTFSVYNWGSQAVVYSLTSGTDEDGTWVEGSSFTLMHNSPSSLIVYWLRTVNNLNLSADNPDFYFTWEFSGEMHKFSK